MPDTQATLEAVSDEALARRIAGGPAGATDAEEAELYRRFAPRVRLYGRCHLRDGAGADDLAQDVLLLTIERLRAGEVRQLQDIGSFILGTSRMMAHGKRRAARRREGLAARFLDARAEAATPSLAALDAPRVAACLRGLADRDRLVVLLTFYAAGLGVAFLLAGIAFSKAMGAFRWVRDRYTYIRVAGGITLVAFGLLLFFERDWWLYVLLNRVFERAGIESV